MLLTFEGGILQVDFQPYLLRKYERDLTNENCTTISTYSRAVVSFALAPDINLTTSSKNLKYWSSGQGSKKP